MQSRFEFTSSATTHDYLTDRVQVTPELDADNFELPDGTLEQEVRGVRLLVEMSGVFEQTAGTDKSANRLWLGLIAGDAIRFYPDQADLLTYVDVAPDLGHKPTLLAVRLGVRSYSQSLRFKSKTKFPVGDAMLARFMDLQPTL